MNDFDTVDVPICESLPITVSWCTHIGAIILISVYGIRLCDELVLLDVA